MYELINVSKSYGKNQIFTNLNFTIESKKFTGIFGESGSGKTTLVSILGMLDQKYTGNYIFNGINITQLGDRELSTLRKEKIGFLFQESYLINEITVFDNLLLNVLDKENKQLIKRIRELMDKFAISDFLYRRVSTLSGGEKQRVALVRALLMNPELIIADEPTGNLDKTNSEIILSYLKSLCLENKTVIVVSHDEKVLKYCDIQYNLIRNGKLERCL